MSQFVVTLCDECNEDISDLHCHPDAWQFGPPFITGARSTFYYCSLRCAARAIERMAVEAS